MALPDPVKGPLRSWASNLRFPTLFVVTAIVFFVDLVVPDLIPFADEILLALATVLFGTLRKRRRRPSADDPT